MTEDQVIREYIDNVGRVPRNFLYDDWQWRYTGSPVDREKMLDTFFPKEVEEENPQQEVLFDAATQG